MKDPGPENGTYSVIGACQRIGISRSTLLRYEAIGLFPPPLRNQANGYRYYTAEDIEKLRQLLLEGKAS